MEVQGELIVKNETKSYGDKGFQKREFVLKTDEKYPQEIQLELTKENCSLLDDIKIGTTIKVAFNLNGRSWTNPQGEVKYFNSLVGWKLEAVGVVDPFQPAGDLNSDYDDDLGF